MVFRISRGSYALLLTCEHGGHRIPREYRAPFDGRDAVLKSHRGWDPGALDVARTLSRLLVAPLRACTVSRLVVDANRSEHHPRLLSDITRALPPEGQRRLVERHYAPHRRSVIEAVEAAIGRHGGVLHIAVHSFTPVLGGVTRDMDVGLLYDPRRVPERRFAASWQAALGRAAPAWRVRRNAPYRGVSDGLTTALRRQYPASRYAGLELELNQRLIPDPPRARAIARTIASALSELAAAETMGAACR